MKSLFAGDQIIGDRERQEDAYAILDLSKGVSEHLVFTIADGMGGHDGAAAIARIAVRQFCLALKSAAPPYAAKMAGAMAAANNAIAVAGIRDPHVSGAGCTLLAALFENGLLSWISVGDCTLHLFRNGRLRRLNADHSYRTMAAVAGSAPRHASRKDLRSALTGKPIPLVDVSVEPIMVNAGDAILLASDGFETLDDRMVSRVLQAADGEEPERVVARLLHAIGTKGMRNQDNATAIFCRPRPY